MRAIAWLGLAIALTACAGDTNASLGTTVRLDVRYEDSWSLGELGVAARDLDERVEVSHELLLTLPDDWAGEELDLVIDGFRAAERYAHGEVTITAELGVEVQAAVTLTRLPCGAWCTEGAMQCEGDGVVVCEQRDDDACMEWSAVVPCSSDAPFCSLGTCLADCVDECAEGETTCDGPGGVRVCGEGDTDSCLDWLPVVACAEGETCSAGTCGTVCRDECADGAVHCAGSGTAVCGDLNLDGCTEWGPVNACPAAESCSAGACEPITSCSDECTVSTCDGLNFTQCGNYDLDPCMEPSPGTSCVPAEACLEGRCTPAGCETSPRICAEPPASECIDSDTLRVYDTTGVCETGDCAYNYDDRSCPSCPSCDACAGVTCTTPPSECYQDAGSCTAGSCSYAYDDGADCNDGNTCTTGDTCATGVCVGTPMTCAAPPAPTCIDANTLRSYSGPGSCTGGTCGYPPADMTCADGCSGGECIAACTPGLWTATTADSAGDVILNTSLAVDSAGGLHVSYGDFANDDLKYAYKPPSGSWTTFTVDAAGDVGDDTSIALDDAGGVHISYFDYANFDLKYAYKPPSGSWTTFTVDAAGKVGDYTSIALDDAGGAHISYRDRTNYDLKYAYKPSGGSWTTFTVDAAGEVGWVTSLALDDAGGVHISYLDWTNYDLKYAYKPSGGGWTTVTVDAAGRVGWDTSIALDRTGGVHISYYDGTNEDLKYAYKSPSGGWTTFTVDAAGNVGYDASIALDRTGGVHISYWDLTNYDLKYAHKSPGRTWTTVAVDAVGDVGHGTSIALDRTEGAHISYGDSTNEDLKYAYRGCL